MVDGPDPEFGVVALDVTDPARPREIGHLNTPGWAGDLALDGRTLYVADGPGGLRVLDVADPAAPREIGALPTAVRAYGIDHAAGRVYVADNAGGLRIVDVADPTAPADLGALTFGAGAAYGVAVGGDRAWVAIADGVARPTRAGSRSSTCPTRGARARWPSTPPRSGHGASTSTRPGGRSWRPRAAG